MAAKRHWDYPPEWLAEWQSALAITPAYLPKQRVVVAAAADGLRGFYAREPARRKPPRTIQR